MFEKLKQHWKVNGVNLILIITTFALGGSLCGYAGRKLLALTNLDKGVVWVVLYIILITLLWPAAVLLVSIPLGQFSFFKKYIGKVFRRFTTSPPAPVRPSHPGGPLQKERGEAENKTSSPALLLKEKGEAKNTAESSANDKAINVAIFASGGGSNAEQIITSSPALLQKEKGEAENITSPPSPLQKERGEAENTAKSAANGSNYKVALIVCNKSGAGVLEVAAKAGIPSLLIEKERFFNGDNYLPELKKHNIDFIVLAGFLWKVPEALIRAYPKKIINIHPALLPKYGGTGMYGRHVHEAVISNKEKQSGITIHYVDELYDHGEIIFQAACAVEENDTAETLAKKVQALEHEHYAQVIRSVVISV
jgi:folate-dependent phosphoribosylglycinamide formyltransferase PurN